MVVKKHELSKEPVESQSFKIFEPWLHDPEQPDLTRVHSEWRIWTKVLHECEGEEGDEEGQGRGRGRGRGRDFPSSRIFI